VLERKPTTVADYGSILRRHLAPHFGEAGIDKITTEHLAAYMVAKAAEGLSTKTISNHLNFAPGLFAFAVKRGWAESNPVDAVDRPRVTGTDPDIRYLAPDEVEALLRVVRDDQLGSTDRVLYLTATMAGLRQGVGRRPALRPNPRTSLRGVPACLLRPEDVAGRRAAFHRGLTPLRAERRTPTVIPADRA
jgi:integrase